MRQTEQGMPAQEKVRGDLLGLLKQAQGEYGYLSRETITELANSLGLSISDVYGVSTFYSFLSTKPLGRNVIRICRSIPCFLRNSQTIIESMGKEIGIKPGETTADGRFSFQLTNCIGACDKAPAMMINNDIHVNLTPEKILQILKIYK